ncbi:hypothetical protein CEXT_269511 [Caerostris extrusa]|uniref:Uncharacterized protein n=1 Tax=Caerostris extrusa TaxID=172846 RepID=A0AAV4MQ90_CAEEX|nr:hypothetical protein CEXT_269511 [Caerostris extrusa]
MATHLRHQPLLVEALRSFILNPGFCFQPPPPLPIGRNAPIILERPGPVSYAADAPISNNPNVRKMARFSNAQCGIMGDGNSRIGELPK